MPQSIASIVRFQDDAGVIAELNGLQLKAAPIEPSWIVAGQPRARSGSHSASRDRRATTNVWECTAGAFRWYFGWDETVLILEGSVRVTSPSGQTIELKAGDIAYFSAFSTWTWEVDQYVRKLAFNRRPASRIERLLETLLAPVRRTISMFRALAVRIHQGTEPLVVTLWYCAA